MIPLITHHGTPGVGVEYEPFVRAAAERGLRHVAYSRPGYADAPRQPGRAVASCAADVERMLDELGAERCYTLGWSGGGPHALACAALLPERVIKAATIAGVAPFDADGLDFLAGMGEENIEEFAAVEAGEEALRAYLEREAAGLRDVTAEQVVAAFGDLIGEADRAVLTGEYADYVAGSMRRAVSGGVDGWLDDDLAFRAAWGFDLGAIEVPVTVWQGDDDRMVPFAHGKWLAAHVSGARAELRPGEGHISISLAHYGEILDDLLAG